MKKNVLFMLLFGMILTIILPAYADDADMDNCTHEVEAAGVECIFDNNEADSEYIFSMYIQNQLYYGLEEERYSAVPSSRFSGNNAVIYDEVKRYLPAIASGEINSTVIEIPVKALLGEKLTYTFEELGIKSAADSDIKDKVKAFFEVDEQRIIMALKVENPYEMYWYGNNNNTVYPDYSIGFDKEAGQGTISFYASGKLVFKLAVSKDYMYKNEYTTDVSKTSATSNAVNNALDIVREAENLSDEEKLHFYCDKICELTSYNKEAVSIRYSGGYGNPWQLIWAFDGDPDTKIVCEGYSKAFKFLCDATHFDGDIYVYITTGNMSVGKPGRGLHMWNIVHMDDGRNYLADLTNVDENTIGYEGKTLFLVPISGGTIEKNNYHFNVGDKEVYYSYDGVAFGLYSMEELTLSDKKYFRKHLHEYDEGVVVREASCLENGIIQYTCNICDDSYELELDMLSHDIVIDEAIKPTYTESGRTEGKHCARCGYVFVESELLPPTGPSGWLKKDGKWYFYDRPGYLASGWINDEGKFYYIDKDGVMTTGLSKIDGTWYLFRLNGEMAIGWGKADGKWYYMDEDGHLVTGWVKDNGKWYYLGADGAMKTGLVTIGTDKFFFKETGEMVTGLLKLDGRWHLFRGDGTMAVNGFGKADGYWYYFDEEGVMITGWVKDNGEWYYFGAGGEMKIGFTVIEGETYYFRQTGAMACSETLIIDGQEYTFRLSGALEK